MRLYNHTQTESREYNRSLVWRQCRILGYSPKRMVQEYERAMSVWYRHLEPQVPQIGRVIR